MKLIKKDVRKAMAIVMTIMLSLTALFVSANYDAENYAAILQEPVLAAEPTPPIDFVSSYDAPPWVHDGSIPAVAFDGRGILLFSPSGENSWSFVSLILAVLGVVLGVLTAIRFVLKKRDERYDDFDTYYDDDIEEERKRNRTLCFITTIATAITGIILFLIFNDIRTPLVLVNIWTILSAIVFAIEAVAVKLIHKRLKKDDQEEQAATA